MTDLIFLNTGDRGFATASHWLLGFGIGTALLAATFGLIDYMFPFPYTLVPLWPISFSSIPAAAALPQLHTCCSASVLGRRCWQPHSG